MLSLAFPLLALASAASAAPMQAPLLPPGVDGAACPNYPYCSDLNPIIPQATQTRAVPFNRQQLPTAAVGQVQQIQAQPVALPRAQPQPQGQILAPAQAQQSLINAQVLANANPSLAISQQLASIIGSAQQPRLAATQPQFRAAAQALPAPRAALPAAPAPRLAPQAFQQPAGVPQAFAQVGGTVPQVPGLAAHQAAEAKVIQDQQRIG